jgi:uncharacterized FlaG/YvyC family protein
MQLLLKAKEYAIHCHEMTAHKYNGLPYEEHLRMVVNTANNFIHLIPEESQETVLAACWVHDVIEDCRQTYNDVKTATNEAVAELAYALTNEKGRNRKERANEKYYTGIKNTPFATFVKVCDRIANYEYSKKTESSMAKMYEKEMGDFIRAIYDDTYKEMFDYLLSQMQGHTHHHQAANILNGKDMVNLFDGGNYHHLSSWILYKHLTNEVTSDTHITLSEDEAQVLEEKASQHRDRMNDKYGELLRKF